MDDIGSVEGGLLVAFYGLWLGRGRVNTLNCSWKLWLAMSWVFTAWPVQTGNKVLFTSSI